MGIRLDVVVGVGIRSVGCEVEHAVNATRDLRG
jgi:hypothetical protein